MPGTHAPGPDVGPLPGEAAKLVEALQYWAEQRLSPMAEAFGGTPECAVCPICRVMSVVRGEHPEVVEHLADAVASLAAAVSAALAPGGSEGKAHDHSPGPVRERAAEAG